MNKALIVVDMQNDFITGSLGTEQARKITEPVISKIMRAEADGAEIIFTMDTHGENYSDTQEGRILPVRHCVEGTDGWQLAEALKPYAEGRQVFRKPTFGSTELAEYLKSAHIKKPYEEFELIGLCTDICVISNAMLIKAYLPDVRVSVDASCCAGVTEESHQNALRAMRMCQINIISDK